MWQQLEPGWRCTLDARGQGTFTTVAAVAMGRDVIITHVRTLYISYTESPSKYTGWCMNDFTAHG
jgi:hypothetical protein